MLYFALERLPTGREDSFNNVYKKQRKSLLTLWFGRFWKVAKFLNLTISNKKVK